MSTDSELATKLAGLARQYPSTPDDVVRNARVALAGAGATPVFVHVDKDRDTFAVSAADGTHLFTVQHRNEHASVATVQVDNERVLELLCALAVTLGPAPDSTDDEGCDHYELPGGGGLLVDATSTQHPVSVELNGTEVTPALLRSCALTMLAAASRAEQAGA